jgi:hypothetical protein
MKLSTLVKSILTEDDAVLGTEVPLPLKQIASKKDGADAVVGGGVADGDKQDDIVAGKETVVPVGELKPAQTEIIVDKAVAFALGFLNTGQPDLDDMEAIVSKDNYIMDGHHRWAARFLIDPTAKVKVTRIDLPGGPLVTVLNLITVGKLGITIGNKGKGNVADFTGEKIGQSLDDAMATGTKQWPKQTPDQVKEALGKIPGAEGDPIKGKELMIKNADALPKQIMPGAPPRIQMPVIDGKKVALVQKMLEKGLIDIKPPYSKNVQARLDVADSVQKPGTLVESVKNRLSKLANIKK